jgi:hypothetical protein
VAVTIAVREALQQAVDQRGAERVGREAGVSGEQLRQFLAGTTKTVRSDTASRYERWAIRQASGWQAWEPAITLAASADAIAGLLERALEQQRQLALEVRDLSPGMSVEQQQALQGLPSATPPESQPRPASVPKARRRGAG